jgi:GNAT superfamily N-acetyltransferase
MTTKSVTKAVMRAGTSIPAWDHIGSDSERGECRVCVFLPRKSPGWSDALIGALDKFLGICIPAGSFEEAEDRLMKVHVLQTPGYSGEIETLMRAYYGWCVPIFNAENGLDHGVDDAVANAMAGLDESHAPGGATIMAWGDNGQATGVGFLRRIRADVGEIKRLYVDPVSRGSGLGRALLDGLIGAARDMDMSRVYLDTGSFMQSAHGLYRTCGFAECAPYPESDHYPDEIENVLFMRLDLE